VNRRSAGAAAFIVGGLQYVTTEAIAAAAWVNPRYSYTYNYISDLGVPEAQTYDGRVVNSPLAWVMNTGFILEGVFFLVGAVLLAHMFIGVRRHLFVSFALVHGVGIVLVGLFHEAADAGSLHVGGAFASIIFGNLTALLVGLSARRLGLPSWFGILFIVVPILGLASEVVLVAEVFGPQFDGLWERGGVYSVTAFQVIFGAVVLRFVTSRQIRR
jgi:hypothetical membrane protein